MMSLRASAIPLSGRPQGIGLAGRSALLALFAAVVGCSHHPGPTLTVASPKPYLLVETSGTGAVSARVVYLPDRSREVFIRPKARLGGQPFEVALTEQGFLAGLTAGPRGFAIEPSQAGREELTGAGAPPFGEAVPAAASPSALMPGLYEIIFAPASGQALSLRRVPFEVPAGQASATVSVLREVRFLASPESPERPRELLVSLDGVAGSSACPPPGLYVALSLDGEAVPDPCQGNPEVICEAAAQQVRCPLGKIPGLHSYHARVTAGGEPGGAWRGSVVEAVFPPGGFLALAPTARVSFGTLPDGRVRTIAVEYDPRAGSCVDPDDPGRLTILAEGVTVTATRQKGYMPSLSRDCLKGVLIPLDRPAQDVSVAVEPRNRADLRGAMIFATAAAAPRPPRPPAPPPPQPVFSPVQETRILVQPEQITTVPKPQDGPPKPEERILVEPPLQPHSLRAEIAAVRGNLEGSHFSDFLVTFRADPRAVSHGIPIKVWRREVKEENERDREQRVSISIAEGCLGKVPEPCQGEGSTGPLSAALTSVVDSGKELKATIPLPREFLSSSEPADLGPFLYCLEIRFQGSRPACYRVIADESLLKPAKRLEP